MQVHYLLYACCSSSLVRLHQVVSLSILQKVAILEIALWIQVIRDGKRLLQGSHPQIAQLREFWCVLVHNFHETLLSTVKVRIIILNIVLVDLRDQGIVVLPSLEHGVRGSGGDSELGIGLGIFGSVGHTCC